MRAPPRGHGIQEVEGSTPFGSTPAIQVVQASKWLACGCTANFVDANRLGHALIVRGDSDEPLLVVRLARTRRARPSGVALVERLSLVVLANLA